MACKKYVGSFCYDGIIGSKWQIDLLLPNSNILGHSNETLRKRELQKAFNNIAGKTASIFENLIGDIV